MLRQESSLLNDVRKLFMTVAKATIDGFVEISAIPSVFSAAAVGGPTKMLSVKCHDARM